MPVEYQELITKTKRFASESHALSWWYFSSTLLLLTLVCLVTTLAWYWPIRLGLSLLMGLLLTRMSIIYHDIQHGSLLRGDKLAHGIMRLFGIVILSPASGWNFHHNYHHSHNSHLSSHSLGEYPIITAKHYARLNAQGKLKYRISRHPTTILFAYFSVFFYLFTWLPAIKNPRKHKDCVLALILFFSVTVSGLYYFSAIYFFSYLIPGMFSAALGAYLFYMQHNFPGARYKISKQRDYVFAALYSSSFLNTSKIMHWFIGNVSYHHIHHINAQIPFYKLPKAMQAIPELQNPICSSLHPRDILACLRLKLWDEDTEELISLSVFEARYGQTVSAT